MTSTDFLLLVLIALVGGRIVQAHYQHQALTRWLDSLGDLTGDLLRGILEAVRGRLGR